MIKQVNDITYSIDTVGLGGDEKMYITLPPCQCGEIKNGIALSIGLGEWAIDVGDFLTLAEIVKRHLAKLKSEEQS